MIDPPGPADERPFAGRRRPTAPDILAPDGSEIRLIGSNDSVSVVECRLPGGAVTTAVRHRTVEEIWYVIAGHGRLWRWPSLPGSMREGNARADRPDAEDPGFVAELGPGAGETIPVGTSFQFRADPGEDLVFVIATTPPWPGAEEATRVAGPWEPSAT